MTYFKIYTVTLGAEFASRSPEEAVRKATELAANLRERSYVLEAWRYPVDGADAEDSDADAGV